MTRFQKRNERSNPGSAVTRVNALLKAAGLEQRLIRGRGYYYVTNVAVSSMLCVMWLNPTDDDFEFGRDHVNEVLAAEGLTVRI